jgi:hypothetical protein
VEVFVANARALLDGDAAVLFGIYMDQVVLEEDVLGALQNFINEFYEGTDVGE